MRDQVGEMRSMFSEILGVYPVFNLKKKVGRRGEREKDTHTQKEEKWKKKDKAC